MRIQVFPLDFLGQGALLEPKDRRLHDLAVDYCKREILEPITLASFAKVWVSATVDREGNPEEVTGITGYVLRPDIPMFRTSGDNAVRSAKMLTDRLNSFFADSGARGTEVFIHISGSERPEQRCSKWQESLAAVDARPADRFKIKVR